jgi:hypothetical protein
VIFRRFGESAILPNERSVDFAICVADINDAAALARLMRELGYETTK